MRNLDSAYRGFFRRVAENKKLPEQKRKVPGFPKYKSKKGRQGFQCPQACRVDFQKGTIDIPKCKGIKAVLHRRFEGKVKTVTISMEPSGKCFASVLVEDGIPEPETRPVDPSTAMGVDVGGKTLAVCSDGTVQQSCRTRQPECGEECFDQHIFFRRRRYRVANDGSLCNPKLRLVADT